MLRRVLGSLTNSDDNRRQFAGFGEHGQARSWIAVYRKGSHKYAAGVCGVSVLWGSDAETTARFILLDAGAMRALYSPHFGV
ncbi:MAG: hypothetical protein A2Z30_02470 [Chloroflexi bacterium RBG_16_64_43]|nr:MAG: hypothetical protein A2Z30_02470 [Chloroflexi bacterium RBG_16_64_43]